MTGHTSNSAAVNDEMPALSSFRCSFNSAVSVTLVFCISSFDASEKGVGLGTYAFDGYVELLGDDGSQAACEFGHDGDVLLYGEGVRRWSIQRCVLKEVVVWSAGNSG